jgi:hypothetical protein
MYIYDYIYEIEIDTMPDLETNFAIAIIGMTIFCIVLVGVPMVFMLAKTFRLRRKSAA